MFKNLCYLFLLTLPYTSFCQEITKTVMMGDQGETTDVRAAKFLLVEKKINDTIFQRIGYHFAGPMMKIVTFRDADMTIRQGDYREFDDRGYLTIKGAYRAGKKDGDWYRLDDTLGPVLHTRYQLDSILFCWDLDSIHIHKKIEDSVYKASQPGDTVKTAESEAAFEGGDKGWTAYVSSRFSANYPQRAADLGAAGTVMIQFVIDTLGNVGNYELVRSVEFSLDETMLVVLRNSPRWIPSFQHGHPVEAYRREKITFQPPK